MWASFQMQLSTLTAPSDACCLATTIHFSLCTIFQFFYPRYRLEALIADKFPFLVKDSQPLPWQQRMIAFEHFGLNLTMMAVAVLSWVEQKWGPCVIYNCHFLSCSCDKNLPMSSFSWKSENIMSPSINVNEHRSFVAWSACMTNKWRVLIWFQAGHAMQKNHPRILISRL